MTAEELAVVTGITPEQAARFIEDERAASKREADQRTQAAASDYRALLDDPHLRLHLQMRASGSLTQAQMIASIRTVRARLPQQSFDPRACDMTDACPMATVELEEFDLTREQCEAMADSQFRSDVSRQRWGGMSRDHFVASIDAARSRARTRQIAAHARVCGMWDARPSMHGPAATQLAGAFYDAGMSLHETGQRLRAVAGGKALTPQQIAQVKDNLRAHAAAHNYWNQR